MDSRTLMPYALQCRSGDEGAGRAYGKGLLPFASHVVVDGRLVTGRNPRSAKATARTVAELF